MAGTRISKAGPVFRHPTSADFSPHRYLVARCPTRQSARTLRDKGEIVARLPRHRSRSKSGDAQPLNVAISDDGRLLASASCDGMVRVWDIEAHQMVGGGTSVVKSPRSHSIQPASESQQAEEMLRLLSFKFPRQGEE